MIRVYDAYADEKRDQRIGFIAFPVVNLLVWGAATLLQGQVDHFSASAETVQLKQTIAALPWAANALFLIAALIFRWHIGVGYLVSCGGWAVVAIGLGLLGVVAFFTTTPLMALTGLLGAGVFLLLLLALSGFFLWHMAQMLRRWWKIH